MKKTFTTWWALLIAFSLLSLFLPVFAAVAIILLLVKRRVFLEALEKADVITDADAYATQKHSDADAYESERHASADEYHSKRTDAADSYYHEKTSQAEIDLKQWNERISSADKDLKAIKKQKTELLREIEELSKESIVVAANFEVDETISSEEYKNKLALLKTKLSEFVKNDKALIVNSYGDKKAIRDNSKQILRCFEAESSSIIKAVTIKNVDTQRNKLNKSFENLNKLFEVDGVKLTFDFLECKLEELNLTYAYQLKKEQEKEEQKAIREQMVEEEKVRREIEREKAKIEKEEKQFKNEIAKLMDYLQKSSDIEKQLYIDKIKELEDKLKLVEKDKANVLEREQNTRAGYVYIISNIGSFGENVYKIGMTRRLEPLDRVKELGDASVPFEFDVHAMIFSEDAPTLETTLHNTFKANQVNKVNPRKEFFRVSLPEIEKVVKENHNATVTFTQVAKAEQYRESLRLAEAAV